MEFYQKLRPCRRMGSEGRHHLPERRIHIGKGRIGADGEIRFQLHGENPEGIAARLEPCKHLGRPEIFKPAQQKPPRKARINHKRVL